jgi:hypothetical protein
VLVKRGDHEAGRGIGSVLSHEEVSGEFARVPPFAKGCGVLSAFEEQIAERQAFGSLGRLTADGRTVGATGPVVNVSGLT